MHQFIRFIMVNEYTYNILDESLSIIVAVYIPHRHSFNFNTSFPTIEIIYKGKPITFYLCHIWYGIVNVAKVFY